jgi:hypothetical protein
MCVSSEYRGFVPALLYIFSCNIVFSCLFVCLFVCLFSVCFVYLCYFVLYLCFCASFIIGTFAVKSAR